MKRALLIGVFALAGVATALGLVYAFGTPQAPRPQAASEQSFETAQEGADTPGVSAPQAPASGETALRPDGVAPPADPGSPLAIEIPGCVCHSDDPKLVEEHVAYRMNQCAGCHVGGAPTGAR